MCVYFVVVAMAIRRRSVYLFLSCFGCHGNSYVITQNNGLKIFAVKRGLETIVEVISPECRYDYVHIVSV